MAERTQLPIPTGELLPADERLQNILAALEIRLVKEVTIRDAYREDAGNPDDDFTDGYVSGFVSGIGMAWSLAKTESLRRTDSPK